MTAAALRMGLALALLAVSDPTHPSDEDLGGPPSPYAQLVLALAGRPPLAPPGPATPLRLTCLATAGNDRYIGAAQSAVIRAPLAEVTAILDDVAHYQDLFPGCVDVHVVPGSRSGNRYVTSWEQRAPVFFIPNSVYELTYLVSRPDAARVTYRYRLLRGDSLTNSDGIVILEGLSPSTTGFTEYDFFDAHWGPLPAGPIWRESLRGMFLSDVAVKLHAENPGWSYARIAAEAERLLASEADLITTCVRHERSAASLLGD